MSRGLGKLQQGILDTLKNRPDAISAFDLAKALYETEHPTRAAMVSTRRTIHSLTQKGLVLSGFAEGKKHQLYCWLPGNTPPMGGWDGNEPLIYKRYTGEQYRQAILEVLKTLPDKDDYETFFLDNGRPAPAAVKFSKIKGPIVKHMKLGIRRFSRDIDRVGMALTRAARHLHTEGKISIWIHAEKGHIVYVALL